MKQRNGAGSKRLVEATERFIRSEQKLLEVLGSRRILKKSECDHFAKDLSLSAAKKRSSDVFSSAISINRKLMGILSKSKAGAVKQTTDADVMTALGEAVQKACRPNEAYVEILTHIRGAVAFENATLFIVDRESRSLVEAASIGERVDLIGHVRFGGGRGFSSWVAQQKKPVILNDLHRDGGADSVSLRSFISVPILVQGETVGVLNLSHSRPGAFDEECAQRLGLMTIPISALAIRSLLLIEREKLTTTDDLTSLYNRRHFDRHLEEEVGKAKRYGHKVSVVVFDVDDRKAGKERTGSAVGDQVLSDMGRLLKRSARGTDCVARYSGDEFRILLPHTDASEAKLAADRLRGVVEGHAFPRRKKLTLTVGVATYPTEAVDSAVQAKRAEPVLAEAKVEPPVSLNGNGNGHKAAVN